MDLGQLVKDTAKEVDATQAKRDIDHLMSAEGVKSVLWTPVPLGEETFFECKVEAFGYSGVSTSRKKARALADALRDIAQQLDKACRS